jgi:hypothetical protein
MLSLLEEGSWTDPVTNYTLLPPTGPFDFRSLLQRELYNFKLWPTFLHEATHHWCFSSPVGTALALIKLRALRQAHLLPLHHHGDRDRLLDAIADDLMRYEAAIDILRPLAEGLALFAEFDATPGHAETLSPLMHTFTTLMAANLAPKNTDVLDTTRQLLSDMRSELLPRKANLLARPFSYDGGGYLPGYLAIKVIWRWMTQHRGHNIAFDTDFFLNYIRAYFYDDLELVAILLNDEDQDVVATEAIGLHINDRIVKLFKSDFADQMEAYDKLWAEKRPFF